MSKYDKWGRPTDGTDKNYMVTRPHGRGTFRYETLREAEFHAARFARETGEPVMVWRALYEFEQTLTPVTRREIAP